MNKKQMMEGIKSWDKEEQQKFLKVFNELYNTKPVISKEGKKKIKDGVKKGLETYNKLNLYVCPYCYGFGYVSNGKSKRRCVCNPLQTK